MVKIDKEFRSFVLLLEKHGMVLSEKELTVLKACFSSGIGCGLDIAQMTVNDVCEKKCQE